MCCPQIIAIGDTDIFLRICRVIYTSGKVAQMQVIFPTTKREGPRFRMHLKPSLFQWPQQDSMAQPNDPAAPSAEIDIGVHDRTSCEWQGDSCYPCLV